MCPYGITPEWRIFNPDLANIAFVKVDSFLIRARCQYTGCRHWWKEKFGVENSFFINIAVTALCWDAKLFKILTNEVKCVTLYIQDTIFYNLTKYRSFVRYVGLNEQATTYVQWWLSQNRNLPGAFLSYRKEANCYWFSWPRKKLVDFVVPLSSRKKAGTCCQGCVPSKHQTSKEHV